MAQSTQSAKRRSGGRPAAYILIFAIFVVLFVAFVVPATRLQDEDKITDHLNSNIAVTLMNGKVFRQEIADPPEQLLKAFDICFGTFMRANNGILKVKLYEDDTEIDSWSLPTNKLVDNEFRTFELKTPYPISAGSVYSFTLTDTYRGQNAIAVWTDGDSALGYSMDGEPAQGAINYFLTYRLKVSHSREYLIIASIVALALFLLTCLIYRFRREIGGFCGTLAGKCAAAFQLKPSKVTLLDWIIFAILAVFCYFTMQYSDILHTGGSSFALLRGHFLDFYEYNAPYFGGNSYMITTYIVFALWNLPLALLGLMGPPSTQQSLGVLMWFKALPTLLFVLSAVLFYQICKKYEDKTGISAKWGAFLFMLTPTAFYSQFMFGQYDSLTTFTMLLALKVLLDDKKHSLEWCSLLFGIATTFKYHAMLFFAPILLYREKRLPALIKNAVCFGLPIVLANLPYMRSASFSSGVEGFFALNYFFAPNIPYFAEGAGRNFLVPLLWVVICAYALGRKSAADPFDQLKDMAYMSGLVTWLCFGVVFWHPQWFMIATPFFALTIVVSNRRDVMCLLDIALVVMFMNFTELFWGGMTLGFYNLGVLAQRVAGRSTLAAFNSLYPFCLIKDRNLVFTALSCILLVRALLLRPEWEPKRILCTRGSETLWFRLRGYAGIGILVVPMVICLASLLSSPTFIASAIVDDEAGSVTLSVETDGGFEDFTAAVWNEDNGKDDVAWYPLSRQDTDSDWTATVALQDHNDTGNFIVQYYSYPNGEARLLTESSFTVGTPDEDAQPS